MKKTLVDVYTKAAKALAKAREEDPTSEAGFQAACQDLATISNGLRTTQKVAKDVADAMAVGAVLAHPEQYITYGRN